jgi:hypothetical protein
MHAYILVPKSIMKFVFNSVQSNSKSFYVRPYTSMWAHDLRQAVIEAVEFITPHMLINTWQELEYRLDIY